MSDQWSAGAAADGGAAVVPGSIAEGLPVNQALAIDSVFRYGMALVREQPVLALAGGGLLLAMTIVMGLVSFGVQMALIPVVADMGDMGQVVSQLVSVGLSLVQLPIQLLITAGMMVAFGRYIGTDEVRLGDLFSSIVPALKVFAFSLMVGAGATILMSPAIGVVVVGSATGGDFLLPSMALAALLGLVAAIALVYVSLGLVLVPYAIAIDGLSIGDAIRLSWSWMDGGRLTVFVTNLVIGLLSTVAGFAIYCLGIGLILQPAVVAIQTAGFAAGWLLMARSRETTSRWAFFERNNVGF